MKHLLLAVALGLPLVVASAAVSAQAPAADPAAPETSAPPAKPAAAPPAPTTPGTPQRSKMKACNADAKDKHGDERRAFMKQCLSAKPKPAAG